MQIKESITINSGVTLILPYVYNGSTETNQFESDGSVSSVYHNATDSGTDDSERNPMQADTFATDTSKDKEGNLLCSTKVIVCENVTISVNGIMIIAGQLDGGGGGMKYAGQTAGYHARLILKDNAYLAVSGELRVLGYIDDNSNSDTPAIVNIASGATLCEPFIVRDFKGGTIMSAIYSEMSSYSYSPFNQFQFINITAKVVINSGGTMKAYANLYARGHNYTIGNMVGNNKNYVIQLMQGGRLEAKYNSSTDILDIHIFGGASTNALKLNAAGTDVSSDDFVFPISWMFNITLDRTEIQKKNGQTATYNLNQEFKLMPGSVMTIAEGATLRVNSLIVYGEFTDGGTYYSNFTDVGTNLPGQYPSTYPASSISYKGQPIPEAKLTVNGTLIAVRLGGKIYTEYDPDTTPGRSAVVQATSSVSVTSYEPKSSADAWFGLTKEIDTRFTITLPIMLYSVDDTLLNNTTTIYPGIQYYTEEGIWQVPPYFVLIAGEGYDVVVSGGKHLKLDDNGNPIIENGAFVYDTEEYRSANYRDAETGEVTRGVYLLTTQPGTQVTYILQNRYVIPSEMETTYNSSFESSIQGERTVTKTIVAPLEVKYVPVITINNTVASQGTTTLEDSNADGILELKISFTTEGACRRGSWIQTGRWPWQGYYEYNHTLPTKFKVNVNGETVEITEEDGSTRTETVYEKCVLVSSERCENHSDENDANALKYSYDIIAYSKDGAIVITVIQDN